MMDTTTTPTNNAHIGIVASGGAGGPGEPQPMARNGPAQFPAALRRLRHVRAISGRRFVVPHADTASTVLPSTHLMNLYFTLHEEAQDAATSLHALEEAASLPAPLFCSETELHAVNPVWSCWSVVNSRRGVSWAQLPHTRFVLVVWDSSTFPIRIVFKTTLQLADLMFVASTDLDFPPNTLLFHLFDGIYVPKEIRFDLEERAIIVRDESSLDASLQPPPISSTAKPSLSRSMLTQWIRRKKEADSLRLNVEQLEKTITEKQSEQAQALMLQRRITEKQESIDRMRALVDAKRASMQRDTDELNRRREALLPQAQQLRQAQIALSASVVTMEEQRQQLITQQRQLEEANFLIRFHASRLIAQLRTIYRIEHRIEDGYYTINGIVLPNSVFVNCDEETIAAGLGHVCHVVHLLSRYLGVPLRYPMRPMQTRSTIEDPISNIGKYPLYSRNQDPTQFEYAVFLLNKNLEQLIHSEGLEIESLRPTLPNLKLLLDSFHPPTL